MEKVRDDSAASQENQECGVHATLAGGLLDYSKVEIFGQVNWNNINIKKRMEF